MHLDCKASFVPTNSKPRYCDSKVGVGEKNGVGYVVLWSNTTAERLKVDDISSIFSSNSKPLLTVTFRRPAKVLSITSTDIKIKQFAVLLKTLREKGTKESSQLPHIESLETKLRKDGIEPKSLSVVGFDFNPRELANQSLKIVKFEKTKLLPKLLWRLSNLSELHLTNCSLSEVPERLVNLGATLTYLRLSNNSIKEMDGNVFRGLRQLTHLNVSNNEISVLPLEILLLKNLISLNISRNKVRKVPFTLSALSQLKDLNVSENELQYLPLSVLKPRNPRFKPSTFDFAGNASSDAFRARLQVWHDTKKPDSAHLPSLLDRSAAAALRSLVNINVMHITLPKTVYDYVQLNSNQCHFCMRACIGAIFITEISWTFDWNSFAATVHSDARCRRMPVIAYACWRCAHRRDLGEASAANP